MHAQVIDQLLLNPIPYGLWLPPIPYGGAYGPLSKIPENRRLRLKFLIKHKMVIFC